MKINDLKRPTLEEGFIDNFIAKVQNMAGEDGPTGVLRALRGQNAALNKFADVIANATTPKVTERLGNQAQAIDDGTGPTPVGMILKQAEIIGSAMANREGIEVTPAEIQSTIANSKEDILKMLLVSDDAEDATVRSLFQAVVLRSPNVRLRDSLSVSIRTISLIVAGTIIYIKTTKEDLGDFVIDPTDLQKFNDASEQVTEMLFGPRSSELRTLQPNEELKDNLQWLILQMAKAVKEKYAVLDNAQLQGLLASPPALVSPLQLKSALSSHDNTIDPAVVSQVIANVTPVIQSQFNAWLEIAVKETAGGRPATESLKLYVPLWSKEALETVNSLKFSPTAKAEPDTTIEPAGKEIPLAGEEPSGVAPDIASIVDAAKKLSASDKTKLTGQLLSVLGGGEANPARRV